MPGFDPQKDIPDLTGKVILVTGGTAGVGAGTVIELVRHKPAHVLFTGRKAKSAEGTIASAREAAPDVPVTFVEVDLANLASVKAATEKILGQLSRLDVLICNAGIMAVPASVSVDGYEIHMATNHLGHALLVRKLLPLLQSTSEIEGSDVRIITLTSAAWAMTPKGGIQFDRLKSQQDLPMLGRWIRYGQSKFANMVYARELAARYPKILSLSLTPGVVTTGLVTNLGLVDKAMVYLPNMGRMKTPEEGTHNTLWAVSAPREKIKSGAYYEPVGELSNSSTKDSKDPQLGGKLWEWTEAELKPWL
ncbi:hypothetical protein OQA88_2957 [Cercophora sp. LCS_1]